MKAISLNPRSLVISFTTVFLMATTYMTEAAAQNVIQVGPSWQYTVPSQAADVAQEGDIIEIDAGLYEGDVAIWWADNLTIRGVGGRAHLKANGNYAQGKGTWVIKGRNTTVENIEFSEAAVPDQNGAGIRQEGADLTVRNCYFHDNENGILGPDAAGDVLIEYSEFANNGFGDGFSHNMYILNTTTFTLRYCYIHHAKIGHNVKSRAQENYILYNRIMDEETGTASYAIDLPNGGTSYIVGNLIQQGPDNDNSTIINYGSEGLSNPSLDLYVVNNTIVNDYGSGAFVYVEDGATPAQLINNLFVGPGTLIGKFENGSGQLTTNLQTNAPQLANIAGFDYRLNPGSPAIDAGSNPGTVNGFDLTPVSQYVHPLQNEGRVAIDTIDIGAYEFGNGTPVPVEFISFSVNANEKGVILVWSTASETNNYGFEIERKSRYADFAVVGFVAGSGTSSQIQSYTFLDTNVESAQGYVYRLKQIDLDGTFEYSQELIIEIATPTQFRLLGNYPNPFNPETTISFEIPVRSEVTLTVYDVSGRIVRHLLFNEVKEPGRYSIPFAASQLSSGVYFSRLSGARRSFHVAKMLLIK